MGFGSGNIGTQDPDDKPSINQVQNLAQPQIQTHVRLGSIYINPAQSAPWCRAVTVGGEIIDVKVVNDKLPKSDRSKIQLRQETDESILLEVESYFDCEELACGPWNKQCLQNNSNDPEPIFSPQASDRIEPVNYTDRLFLPTVTPNDYQTRHAFNVCSIFRDGDYKGLVLGRATTAQLLKL